MSITEIRPAVDDARRTHLTFELAVLDCAADVIGDRDDIDPISAYSVEWTYTEPHEAQEWSAASRRSEALAWLARHAKVVTEIARRMGHTAPVDKTSSDTFFGVEAYIGQAPAACFVGAKVPSKLTCKLVETGETRTIPAAAERTEPVMERICLPSIFAGIEHEVAA